MAWGARLYTHRYVILTVYSTYLYIFGPPGNKKIKKNFCFVTSEEKIMIRIRKPVVEICRSGSGSKHHGSGTLIKRSVSAICPSHLIYPLMTLQKRKKKLGSQKRIFYPTSLVKNRAPTHSLEIKILNNSFMGSSYNQYNHLCRQKTFYNAS
jgi:hypothetical protein